MAIKTYNLNETKLKYQIKKKYYSHKLIVVCADCLEDHLEHNQEKVMHKIYDKWFSLIPEKKHYDNYSHGWCPKHLNDFIIKSYASFGEKSVQYMLIDILKQRINNL